MRLAPNRINNILIFSGLFLILTDQVLKHSLRVYYPSLVFLNQGIAFGQGSAWLAIVGLAILTLLAWSLRAKPGWLWFVLLAAVASNGVDRLLYGGVIDYLALATLRFNLADLLILGAVGYLTFFLTKKDA